MKIEKLKDNKLLLRIKLADGTVDEENFVVSVLSNGSGIVVEFDDDKYLITTEEIIKEVIKFGEL